jgi:hypothetical protein
MLLASGLRHRPSTAVFPRRKECAVFDLPTYRELIISGQPFDIRCHPTDDPGWTACERDLQAQGVPIPLMHRRAWAEHGEHLYCLISASNPDGPCRAAFAVELSRTRAAPGHRIARVERLGASPDPPALRAALVGFTRMFSPLQRILRLELAMTSPDEAAREAIGAVLSRSGFSRLPEPRGYERTSIVDLAPDEDAILAGFHPTARRHIRAAGKRRVRLATITSTDRCDAMERLVAETRRRTSGRLPKRSMRGLVELARDQPELMRIVGLFAEDDDRLLAFAFGQFHGDHASYADAASTRDREHRFPLGYAPLWELMRWAKAQGASWFDLGGITAGTHDDDEDRLGGISDFKRYFRGQELSVGEEWIAEPHALRAAIASRVSRAAQWARATWHASPLDTPGPDHRWFRLG